MRHRTFTQSSCSRGLVWGGLFLVAAASCVTTSAASRPSQATIVSDARDPVQASPDYPLGPGDKIRVITFGEESLTGTFVVGAGGRVSFPLIGDVRAGERTTRELASEVTRLLADGFLKDPRVSIEITEYRPYYILGEVNKPGLYPFTNGLTVDAAVATAGGFTYRANTHKVFIKPEPSHAERKTPLTSDTQVHPGDTVRIAERYF